MYLYFSGSSHLNATYRNEDSQALYKVECHHPTTSIHPTAKISHIVPSEGSEKHDNFQDIFAPLAEVHFSTTGASIFNIGDKEITTKDYFRRKGIGWYSRHRIFTAPDGSEYRWELTDVSKLYLNDNGSQKKLVAQSHRRRIGVLHKPREACLEILPEGEHILDEIVITFVYVEKKRKDIELITMAAHAHA